MKDKTIILFLIVYLGIIFNVEAQIVENFSDSNFTQNPTWVGDTSKFIINSQKRLQLNGLNRKDTAVLYTSNTKIKNIVWTFDIYLRFKTSSSNYADIYLASDTTVSSFFNGYFIRIGYQNKNVSLYKQIGSNRQEIIVGRNGVVNNSINILRIQIINDEGTWILSTKELTQNHYNLEGSVFDTTVNFSRYLGIGCYYTKTRNMLFELDSISVVSLSSKQRVLRVQDIEIKSDTFLTIFFNKGIIFISDYKKKISITSSLVDSVFYLNNNDSIMGLVLSQKLIKGKRYHLFFKHIQDQDTLYSDVSKEFDFLNNINLQKGDVIFSEIMADPTPSLLLPEKEYLEIFNLSNSTVNLENWQLKINNSSMTFSRYFMLPLSYLILCDIKDTTYFKPFGNVLGINKFSFLPNLGAFLELQSNDSQFIDSLSYTNAWYFDKKKAEGGWSLELVDLKNRCLIPLNWKSSKSLAGGTPGKQNSIFGETIKFELNISKIRVSNSLDTLEVFFNLPINTNVIKTNQTTISTFPELGINQINYFPGRLLISFSSKMELYKLYYLNIKQIALCNGIFFNLNNIEFGVGKSPEPGDLKINEILTDSKTEDADFIEVYNFSESAVDLSKLFFIKRNDLGKVQDSIVFSNQVKLIEPKHYFVLTKDSSALKKEYSKPRQIFENLKFPNLNQSEQYVEIKSESNQKIDAFNYRETLHHPFIRETKGVSLERISFRIPASNDKNWHSASSLSKYGTPGYVNSQYFERDFKDNFLIKISSVVLSPDNDGYQDKLIITIDENALGYIATIKVYHEYGIFIKAISESALLQPSSEFIWQVDNEQGRIVEAGNYVMLVELYNALTGNKVVEKFALAVIK